MMRVFVLMLPLTFFNLSVDASNERPNASPEQAALPALKEIEIVSTIDQGKQPALIWVPEQALTEPRPILVFLHSWSANYKQNNSAWLAEAVKRDWIYLHPNFRGPNYVPDAGGSKLAQQDILDALDWVQRNYKVDSNRIYLAGASGGGHMTLLMAGRYPDRFSAVSAWVPISDLSEWYRFHTRTGTVGNYAKNVATMCGGVPGESPEVDAQYHARSPISYLANVGDLAVDIAAGVHDGHVGSVPVAHSLRAFNAIAASANQPLVSELEIEELWKDRKLSNPQSQDTTPDATFVSPDPSKQKWDPSQILLRRTAGPSRVTIFDGGHEGLPSPACVWLEKQSRPTEVRR